MLAGHWATNAFPKNHWIANHWLITATYVPIQGKMCFSVDMHMPVVKASKYDCVSGTTETGRSRR